jgi:O-antigen/teichoic acid export membrane protein
MIRNIFANFSSRLGVAVLNFAMLLMTTHFLGKETRGIVSIIGLGIAIIHVVSDLANGPSLVYLTPRTRLRTLWTIGSAWAIFTTIIVGIILIYIGNIPSFCGTEILIVAVLIALHSLNQNILLGQQRIKEYNILFILQGIVQIISMAVCIFFFNQKSVYPYIYSNMVSFGLCYLIGLYLIHKNPPEPKIAEKRSVLLVLFTNGFYAQMASLFLILCKLKGQTSLKTILPNGEGEAGIYSTAFALGEAIMIFAASVSAVVLSNVSNHANHLETRKTVFQLGKLSLTLTFLAVAFFVLLPSGFYTSLLGKDFSPVKHVFVTIAPGIIFVSFGTVFGHYFSGAGKHYMNFISGSIALLTTYLTTDYFIEKFGISGAGYSSSASYVLLTLIIFSAFVLVGENRKDDLKQLLPSKQDFFELRSMLKLKKRN